MARMPKRDRAGDRLREPQPEQPARPARPVVPRLTPFEPKLKRTKRRMLTDVIEHFDLHFPLEHFPSRELFPQDLFDKLDAPLGRFEKLRWVTLAASPFGVPRHEERGRRDPDG